VSPKVLAGRWSCVTAVVLLPLPAGGSRGAAAPRACASTSAPPAPGNRPHRRHRRRRPQGRHRRSQTRAAHHRTPGHAAAAEHTAGPTDRDDTTGHDAGHTPPRTPHPDRAPAHAARPTKHPAHRHRDRTGRPDHSPPPTHRTRPQRHEHPKHASHRHARTHHHARPSATPRHDTTRPPPAPPSQATTEPSQGRGDGTRATPKPRRPAGPGFALLVLRESRPGLLGGVKRPAGPRPAPGPGSVTRGLARGGTGAQRNGATGKWRAHTVTPPSQLPSLRSPVRAHVEDTGTVRPEPSAKCQTRPPRPRSSKHAPNLATLQPSELPSLRSPVRAHVEDTGTVRPEPSAKCQTRPPRPRSSKHAPNRATL